MGAALTAFAEHGVGATSIQDVAERVGMSKQALMHHFPTKQQLRAAVYALLSERLRALFPVIVGDLTSQTMEGYRLVVDAVVRFTERAPEECRFVLRELLDDPRAATTWLKEQSDPWLRAVVDIVEAEGAAADPALSDFDAEAHVTAIAGLLLTVGALVHGGGRGDPAWRRRVNDAAIRLIRRGSHLD